MVVRKCDWSREEDEILRREYLITPPEELARKLRRTEGAIRVRYSAIGGADKSAAAAVYRRIMERQREAGFM